MIRLLCLFWWGLMAALRCFWPADRQVYLGPVRSHQSEGRLASMGDVVCRCLEEV